MTSCLWGVTPILGRKRIKLSQPKAEEGPTQEKKEEIQLSPMTKAPTSTVKNPKSNVTK